MNFFRTFVVMWLLASAAFASRAQAQNQSPEASMQTALTGQEPAALTVWNRTLAVFRAPYGANDARRRAEIAAARTESALENVSPEEINYTIVEVGGDRGALVVGGAVVLFGILEQDLPQDGAATLEAAGAQAVDRLQALVRERGEQRRWQVVLRGVVEALLATLAFVAIWLVARRALQRLLARLKAAASVHIKTAAIAGIDPSPLVFAVMGWMMRLAEFALRMAAGYIWLTFVLSRFAYSRPLSQTLGGFLIATVTRMAAAVVDQLPNLVTLAIILFVTRAITAAAAAWFRVVERGDVPLSWLDPVAAKSARRLMVIAIWLFAMTVAYPYVPGANTEAFKGVSVFVGLVVSLGSVGIVGQVIGGLFVTFNRALRPGDIVKIGSVHGVVKEIGVVSVTVVNRALEQITIPNSVVVADAIKNYSRVEPGAVVLSSSVTIGYDTPWRQVRAMLLLAAARTDGVLREPAPVVFETALSDFYVEYELVAHGTGSLPRSVLLSRLHEQILDAFNEHGVQIMSPHFEVQPERRAIVERSEWFAAPAAKP